MQQEKDLLPERMLLTDKQEDKDSPSTMRRQKYSENYLQGSLAFLPKKVCNLQLDLFFKCSHRYTHPIDEPIAQTIGKKENSRASFISSPPANSAMIALIVPELPFSNPSKDLQSARPR